jgi:hypothetical protein
MLDLETPRLRAYESAGCDLNEGMFFEYNGTVYFGADAVNILATLSTPVSTFNRINGALLSKQLVARFLYPLALAKQIFCDFRHALRLEAEFPLEFLERG